MTPEFDRRAGKVLASPYWDMTVETEEEYKAYLKSRDNELRPLKEAIQSADTYDDLSDEMKAIFNRAEAVALVDEKAYEEFVQNDTGGYGRFHSTEI